MTVFTLVERKVFYPSPGRGIMAGATSFYTRCNRPEKMCYLSTSSRSDTTDSLSRRFSTDNGRTWSQPEQVPVVVRCRDGFRRSYPYPGFLDPDRDLLLTMVMRGTLPTDDPLEGLRSWHLAYSVSEDGGRIYLFEEQVIQDGFTAENPVEGVWVGRNAMMIGDMSCRPIRNHRGEILVPVQICPLGKDGRIMNPAGGYTYHVSAVLIGRWTRGNRIAWEISETVSTDPFLSTRGVLEPTLAELPDGRVMMVMRGSNDVKPDLPGYKWISFSDDGGRTWSQPAPWTYEDGSRFYSPSSCSQLIRHSSGVYLWIGNICSRNPVGNWPRYPLVIGEVEPEGGHLLKGSVVVVDDRQPGEDEKMTLSNLMAHEDRETGEILLHLTRLFARKYLDWEADAYLYRVAVQG